MRVAGSSARESRSVVSLFPPAPPGTNDQLSPIRSSRPAEPLVKSGYGVYLLKALKHGRR